MELVAPKDTGDFSITIDGHEDEANASKHQKDLEPGIHVQKSVHVASKHMV